MTDDVLAANPEPVAEKPRRVVKPKAEPVAEEVPDGMAWVTITKAGSGKVSDGQRGMVLRGGRLLVDYGTAVDLERRALAEMDD